MQIKYPALNEWNLLIDKNDPPDAKLRDLLTKALSDTVTEMQAGRHKTVGQAVAAVYARLGKIAKQYPKISLSDSEPRDTIADFFDRIAPGTGASFRFEERSDQTLLRLAA
jgi:hypothetical protein